MNLLDDEVLWVITLVSWVFIVCGTTSGIWMYVLTKYNIRKGNVPPDTDPQVVALRAVVIWPKVFWLTALGLILGIASYLFKLSAPEIPPTEKPDHPEVSSFRILFSRRLVENKMLEGWLNSSGYATDDEGDIGFMVSRMAGTTYMVLHEQPDFLAKVRLPDGTYDPITMERLESLHPWMVFDLTCAHPEYKKLLPIKILPTNITH